MQCETESDPSLISEGNPEKSSWYQNNKERAKATTKAWQEANPERFKELKRDWARKQRIKDSRGKRLTSWRRGGATSNAPSPDYEVLLKDQGGRCGVCGTFPTPKKLFIEDHEHLTGRVRGLLCSKCSIGIAYFKTIKVMEYALKYMKNKTKGIEVPTCSCGQAPGNCMC